MRGAPYFVTYHHGTDQSGTFPERFSSGVAADRFGAEWQKCMVSIEAGPAARLAACIRYSYEVGKAVGKG